MEKLKPYPNRKDSFQFTIEDNFLIVRKRIFTSHEIKEKSRQEWFRKHKDLYNQIYDGNKQS